MSRRVEIVVLLVALPLVPGLLIHVASLTSASGLSSLAVISGVLAAGLAGPRVGVVTALLLSLALGAATIVTDSPPLAAALMAVCAAAYALGARRGILAAIAMAPIAVAFTVAEPTVLTNAAWPNAALTAGVAICAGLWGVTCGTLVHRRLPAVPAAAISPNAARVFAAQLAIVVGASTWVMSAMQWGHGGAWFVMTLFVVIQPSARATWSKTLGRAVGTVLGFGIAMLVGFAITAPTILYLLGGTFFVLAFWTRFVRHRRYWEYALLLTPAVVLLEGAGSSVTRTAESRLVFTLLGAAVALVVTGVVGSIVRLRYDQ